MICINGICGVNKSTTTTLASTTTTLASTTTTLASTTTTLASTTTTLASTTTTPTSTTTTPLQTNVPGIIPITSGTSAVLTYFTDTVFQCITGQPSGNAMAINPLLLGFTTSDWTNLYVNAAPSNIPWCGKTLTVTIKGKSFTGKIIDTCDPTGNPFTDPNTGQTIGGKCDYNNVLDLFGNSGKTFLNSISGGDDFYDASSGGLTWSIQ